WSSSSPEPIHKDAEVLVVPSSESAGRRRWTSSAGRHFHILPFAPTRDDTMLGSHAYLRRPQPHICLRRDNTPRRKHPFNRQASRCGVGGKRPDWDWPSPLRLLAADRIR